MFIGTSAIKGEPKREPDQGNQKPQLLRSYITCPKSRKSLAKGRSPKHLIFKGIGVLSVAGETEGTTEAPSYLVNSR